MIKDSLELKLANFQFSDDVINSEDKIRLLLREFGPATILETLVDTPDTLTNITGLGFNSSYYNGTSCSCILISMVLNEEEFLHELFNTDKELNYVIGAIADVLNSYVHSIENVFYRLQAPLVGYTKAVRPPLSTTDPAFTTVDSLLEYLVPLYSGIVKLVKTLSYLQQGKVDFQAVDEKDAETILKSTFMYSGSSRSESIDISCGLLLSALAKLNTLLAAKRWVQQIKTVNKVACDNLYSDTYKGIFLLAPPIISGEIRPSEWYLYTGYNCDTRHYLYKLQKQSLADNPWMPKAPTYGIHIARPHGGRSSSIGFRTVTAISIPEKIKGRLNRRKYAVKVIQRYKSLLNAIFSQRYGLHVNVKIDVPGTFAHADGVVDVSEKEFRTDATSNVRRSLNINSNGFVEVEALMGLPMRTTLGLPYCVFKPNGAIKENYKNKVFIHLLVTIHSPDHLYDLTNLISNPEEITDKYVKEIDTLETERSFRNHPLVESTVFSQTNAEGTTFGRYLVGRATTLESRPAMFVERRDTRPSTLHGYMCREASSSISSEGNIIAPFVERRNRMNVNINALAPVLLVTEAVLKASKDILEIGSTLSRRVVRAGINT